MKTTAEISRILRRALETMDLRARVIDVLPARPGRKAPKKVNNVSVSVSVNVIAIGKAAPAMAAGAIARWGDFIEHVLVVTSEGTDTSAIHHDLRVEIIRAGHPIPDARSVRAAKRCLAMAEHTRSGRTGREESHLLVLVSGGASALVCAPAIGIRLSDKQAVTRAMLESGASIQEINRVRKHLSAIKGGALARAAAPCAVTTLVASDVIGGAIGDIGSGPSVGDDSTITQARHLLKRYAPHLADLPLVRTGAASNANAHDQKIIASPEELAHVVRKELSSSGFRVRLLPPSQASVDDLAGEYNYLSRRLRSGTAIVRAAEPSIDVREVPTRNGRVGVGGRSTHLAALVGGGLPRDVVFIACATDGVDGSSGTAGAIVDHRFAAKVKGGAAAIDRALKRFDTGTLHREAGTALPRDPSGHNLADIHVLCRA